MFATIMTLGILCQANPYSVESAVPSLGKGPSYTVESASLTLDTIPRPDDGTYVVDSDTIPVKPDRPEEPLFVDMTEHNRKNGTNVPNVRITVLKAPVAAPVYYQQPQPVYYYQQPTYYYQQPKAYYYARRGFFSRSMSGCQ